MCLSAPFVFRKLREMSTMVLPFQCMTRRFVSVTFATGTAFRFSSAARARNFSTSFAATQQAILS